MSSARSTPLQAWHVAAGAKMGDFAGFRMPLEYPSGTVTEHRAVRSGCGIFDVSHMGNLRIEGAAAVATLNTLLTNDLGRIAPGGMQYTLLCNSQGGVVDDMMVTLVSPEVVTIVPNAANTSQVMGVLADALGDAVTDESDEQGIIAVQGPASASVMATLGLPADIDYMTATAAQFEQAPVLVSRSGYTGEHGYEVVIPAEATPALWEALVEIPTVTPAGLGARDTLRTEMGYPLHGHELTDEIGPIEAGLTWAVGWDKGDFLGREALLRRRDDPTGRRLRGIRFEDRGVPRPGMPVLGPNSEVVGETTSGTFSPTLRRGIALALLDQNTGVGEPVTVDVRGREVRATVQRPPFVSSSPR